MHSVKLKGEELFKAGEHLMIIGKLSMLCKVEDTGPAQHRNNINNYFCSLRTYKSVIEYIPRTSNTL